MNCDSVDVKPQFYDWSEGYPDRWDYWAARRCETNDCSGIVNRGAECSECKECSQSHDDGPAICYFYELPDYQGDPLDDAKKLADLPLCIVNIEGDRYGLALSGGGMDLSWEICAAYVALGYLPPACISRDLPRLAGMKMSEEKRSVIKACRESLRCQRDWTVRGLRQLAGTARAMTEGC
jgi:hypothetical protein